MIFVTGGTGLLGAHLLYELAASGRKVRAMRKADSDIRAVGHIFSYYTRDADSLLKNIEWVEADLSDIYSLIDALDGVSHVFHCAARVSFLARDHAQMEKINSEGTANLVNAALERGVQHFCHVSSIAALGRTEHGEPVTEQTTWKSSPDNSAYAISKYNAEREVWRAHFEGLPAAIINPSLIIGPGNWQRSTANMFTKAWNGLSFYTEGATGFVDVRDVARIMVKISDAGLTGERYIINSENASYRNFFELVHEALGKKKPSIKAGGFLSGIAWRAEKIRSAITGSDPLITPETARAAHKVARFSSDKIRAAFPGFAFISLKDSVSHAAGLFLRDRS